MGIVHMVRANINRSGKYRGDFDLKVVTNNLCQNSIIYIAFGDEILLRIPVSVLSISGRIIFTVLYW